MDREEVRMDEDEEKVDEDEESVDEEEVRMDEDEQRKNALQRDKPERTRNLTSWSKWRGGSKVWRRSWKRSGEQKSSLEEMLERSTLEEEVPERSILPLRRLKTRKIWRKRWIELSRSTRMIQQKMSKLLTKANLEEEVQDWSGLN